MLLSHIVSVQIGHIWRSLCLISKIDQVVYAWSKRCPSVKYELEWPQYLEKNGWHLKIKLVDKTLNRVLFLLLLLTFCMTLGNSLEGDFYRYWTPLATNESCGCSGGNYHPWSWGSASVFVYWVGQKDFYCLWETLYCLLLKSISICLWFNNLLRKIEGDVIWLK